MINVIHFTNLSMCRLEKMVVYDKNNDCGQITIELRPHVVQKFLHKVNVLRATEIRVLDVYWRIVSLRLWWETSKEMITKPIRIVCHILYGHQWPPMANISKSVNRMNRYMCASALAPRSILSMITFDWIMYLIINTWHNQCGSYLTSITELIYHINTHWISTNRIRWTSWWHENWRAQIAHHLRPFLFIQPEFNGLFAETTREHNAHVRYSKQYAAVILISKLYNKTDCYLISNLQWRPRRLIDLFD